MSELKVDKVSPRTGNYVALNTVGSKNIIINGDMSIAQRGTSTSSLGADASQTYVLDRFKFQVNGAFSTARYTVSQDTDVPSGQGFAKSSKIDITTADASLNSAYYSFYRQEIEGQNLQYLKKGTANAESTTLSFWVKSNKTGTYICEIDDNDNGRNINKSYTINSANTWEKKTITFAGDTTGTLDNDNGSSFRVFWWLAAGTDFTSGTLATSWESTTNANRAVGQVNLADSTSNYINITGVQLEAGTTASDFEFLPYDMNLQRCYRYCYRIDGNAVDDTLTGGVGYAATTSRVDSMMQFQVPMRAVPSVSEAVMEVMPANVAVSLGSLNDNDGTKDIPTIGFQLNADSGSPFTVGTVQIVRLDISSSAFIEFDAEL